MPQPAAGGIIYAAHMLRARPKRFWDSATSALGVSQTVQPIPGISISFTAETAGAELDMVWTAHAKLVGTGSSAQISARPLVTGPSSFSQQPVAFATYQSSAAATGNNSTVTNSTVMTLGAAGAYTVTLLGTTSANQNIDVYSSIKCVLQEQFA
jgi:hypothetical protein